jgi:hypothetical protein
MSNPMPELADPVLALAADMLDDLERVRIANENRLRQLTRSVDDSDGELRGFGLPETHPSVAATAALIEASLKLEHNAQLNLERILRKHPLGPWVNRTIGVGPKQGARLLAAIGDPYWHVKHNRPRTVSELWAFCGYHVLRVDQAPDATHGVLVSSDPLPAGHAATDTHAGSASGTQTSTGHTRSETQGERAGGTQRGGHSDHCPADTQTTGVGVAAARRRGVKVNWSPTAKMRAYLVSESCVKQRSSPYRAVYDAGREKYAEAVHKVACVRCGPAGKPAQPGSALSKGHQDARAKRLVSKAVLKDLWREAAHLHGAGVDMGPDQAQGEAA